MNSKGGDLARLKNELAELQRELASSNDQVQRFQRFNQQILETTPNIIYIYDLQDRRNILSSQKGFGILGFTPAEIAALDEDWLVQLVHPEDQEKLFTHLERLGSLKDGQVLELEYRLLSANGEWRWLHSRNTIFRRDQRGRPLQILGNAEDITFRREAEAGLIERSQALQAANEQLSALVQDLERRNSEISLLYQLADRLQASRTTGEAYQAFILPAERLFPGTSGALYRRDPSTSRMKAVLYWGRPSGRFSFSPEECWAVVSQQVLGPNSGYETNTLLVSRKPGEVVGQVVTASGAQLCPHLANDRTAADLPLTDSLCVPVLGQGDLLGILQIQPERPVLGGHDRVGLDPQLALTAAETLGLALVNLKLREDLREQSIRDPLTGLFNRRYMEESLERELHRSARAGSNLGVILIDLDLFKCYNDTYGHETGDALLFALGEILRSSVRAGDIACRYGGEEFLLILPDTSLKITLQRARSIQKKIHQLILEHGTHRLGELTASFGVSSYPEHGENWAELIRAADQALYRAKGEGRDRVTVAEAR